MSIIEKSAGHGCSLGLEWSSSNTNGGTYQIQPFVYRYDSSSTDNWGSSFSESLSPDANNNMGTGSWSGLGWGSGSGWRRVDSFAVRKYAKKHSSYDVTLKVYTDSEFGTWNGSWYTLGSKTFTWTITIPARTSYTVSFNNNGGSGSPSSQTKWYGESLTLSSTKPTYSGYAFKRWNTNTSDSGTAYSPGGSYTGNAALSLYAIWNRTVTYNKNTTDTVGSMPSNQTGVKSSAITLSSNTPTRTGYKFYHWNTGSGNGGTTYNKGASYAANNPNVTLYAIWNPIITYKANGGSGSDQTQDKTYGTAATLKAASTFSRSGYTFKRWNTNSSDTGTGYNAGASFSGNSATTLYAIWNHTVTYNANGGSNAPAAQTAIAQTNITISSTQPTRSGHTFLGWNTEADGTGTDYSAGASYSGGNMTLYAKWRVDIQLTNVTCSLVDSNGTADPLGKYVAVGADYDATLSGEDVQSITATMTHSNVGDSDSETSGLGLTGHVDFMFGPYDYADFDPHGNYRAGTLTAENSLGTMEAPLTIATTSYHDPSVNAVTAFRMETSTVGGVLVHEAADDGTDCGIDVSWSAFSSGSQTKQLQVRIERSDGTLIATRTFSNLTTGPTRLDVWADPSLFPDDVIVRGVLLPTDTQFTVTVTLVDAYAAEITSAKSSRADLVTTGYFTLDFLGDAYLYNKTEDVTVDQGKDYYTRSGLGTADSPYEYTVVESPVDADLGDYYEANGHRPGYGIAMGKPSVKEGLDVGMDAYFSEPVKFGDLTGRFVRIGGVDHNGYSIPEYLVQHIDIDCTLGATAPSEAKYRGGISAYDSNGNTASYGELGMTTSGQLYRSYAVRRYSQDGTTSVTNALYLRINDDGTREVSVSDAAAWRTGLNAVNKSGDTITGGTTHQAAHVYMKSTNVDRDGTAPSETIYGNSRLFFRDTSDEAIAGLRAGRITNGGTFLQVSCWGEKTSDHSEVANHITLYVNGDGTQTYGITNPANFRSTIFGGFTNNNGSTTSVATSTNVSLGSVSLAAGKWLVLVWGYAAASASGYRRFILTTESAASSVTIGRGSCGTHAPGVSQALYTTDAYLVEPSATTTYYVWGYQNCGSALNMAAYIRAFRIV